MICWCRSENPRWWPAEELLLSTEAEDYQQGLLLLAIKVGQRGSTVRAGRPSLPVEQACAASGLGFLPVAFTL